MTNDTELREDVRRRYAEAATAVTSGAGEACDCRHPGATCVEEGHAFGPELYEALADEQLPEAAVLASLGCGNPTAIPALPLPDLPGNTASSAGRWRRSEQAIRARRPRRPGCSLAPGPAAGGGRVLVTFGSGPSQTAFLGWKRAFAEESTMDVAIRLSDGRTMMVADVGDRHGTPVLYVSGYGHCRLARHPDDALAAEAGVRLLAIDPPGLGGSDPLPGYGLRTWARDAIELADQRGIGRFAALGWSWGGPYALALGHEHPGRVTSIGLVSALGGWLAGTGHLSQARKEYRNFAALCRLAPPLVKMFLSRQRRDLLADPQAAQERDLAAAPPADRAAAAQPGIAAMLAASQAEAWRQGTAGMFDHSRAVTLPWGFTAQDVPVPASIWQGGADLEILPEMAEHLSQAMPRSSLTMLSGEGHLLLFTHWTAILHLLSDRHLAVQQRQ